MEIALYYPWIRVAHITLAILSVSLFLTRAIAKQAGAAWPMSPWVRQGSVLIDVALLVAGGLLWWLLKLSPDRDPWILAKLFLLLIYIGLGSLALKRARSRLGQRVSLAGAIMCIALIVSIARGHDPWAPLRWVGSGW